MRLRHTVLHATFAVPDSQAPLPADSIESNPGYDTYLAQMFPLYEGTRTLKNIGSCLKVVQPVNHWGLLRYKGTYECTLLHRV
jgi:hypothetical protein